MSNRIQFISRTVATAALAAIGTVSAFAQSNQARLDEIRAIVDAQDARIQQLQARYTALRTRSVNHDLAVAAEGNRAVSQEASIVFMGHVRYDLPQILQPVVISGNRMVVNGANLQIVSGAGQTANGLGNLIIGANLQNGTNTLTRTGSHNIVMGRANEYKSLNGFVNGESNQITDRFATVLSGSYNKAEGVSTLIGTGSFNRAGWSYSTVLTGISNNAGASRAVIGTGNQNQISGGSGNAVLTATQCFTNGYQNVIVTGFNAAFNATNYRSVMASRFQGYNGESYDFWE